MYPPTRGRAAGSGEPAIWPRPPSESGCRSPRERSHRRFVLPESLDIRAARHAGGLRGELGEPPRIRRAPPGPRGTRTAPQRAGRWRGALRNLSLSRAGFGRLVLEARGIGRFLGNGKRPQILYTVPSIPIKRGRESGVDIGRRVCGVRQPVAWGTHSTGRREVRRGQANLERDD